MAVHDTIGDFLTIIRNASSARKDSCTTQHSKMRAAIAAILKDEGYISDFSEGTDEKGFKTLTVDLSSLKIHQRSLASSVRASQAVVSYYGVREIPRVLGGLGVAILTTSKALCALAMPARLALAASSSARSGKKGRNNEQNW